ncbi:MAG TPA: PQQ-binding-like beta-propeller repeat protein, partial [Candidatus Bathyarchaeia archaeon]|nr:PQQ-binding-like beta-propeller repeat protein [Candidatus Bathyarchaeia archaeon]
CIYTPKGLFYEAQTRQNIVAVNKDNGDLMWHRGKCTNNPNVIYVDGNILVGIGEQEGSTLVVDPATGGTIEDLGFKKRSCVRLTATPDSLFCRGWPEGITRYDRKEKKIFFDGSVRPSCNDGVIGANGLLYMGPWLCDCNLTLIGTVALCSAEDAAVTETPCADRLEQAALKTSKLSSTLVSSKDWYAYRGGNAHSGGSKAAVSKPLHPVWTWRPKRGFEPTAPVAACGSVFFAGDDGVVRALDAGTGNPKWTFQTAGRILQPPTIWGGNAYVGSEDGYVYALDAETGGLVWRFRAAPAERRIMVYGTLASTWPANSGVLVKDGIAYVAAGIIDHDGTYLYALDANTGEVKWENVSSGHVDTTLRKGVSAQGGLAIAGDSLWMAGGNVISPAEYALSSGEYKGPPPGDGSPRANRGEEIGVFHDKYLVFGGRLRYSASENVVNPGSFSLRGPSMTLPLAMGKIVPVWDDTLMVVTPERLSPPTAYAAAAFVDLLEKGPPIKKHPAPLWKTSALADSQIQALALASDAVVVLCKSPVSRQLVSRWRICLLDRDKGSIRWEYQLPSAVRPNGLAIDRDGRVIVTLADGGLCCFGGRSAVEAYMTRLIGKAAGDPAETAQAIRLIQETLRTVPDAEGRALLLAGLEKLGVDAYQEAKTSGSVYSWRLLGPVPWDDRNLMDNVLAKEPVVKVDQPCVVDDEKLTWNPFMTVDPNGMVDLTAVYGQHDSDAAYAYAEIEFPAAQDLLLKIGSNDGFVCWFNGKEVGRFDGGRLYRPDNDSINIHANAGRNQILLKIDQLGGAWAMGVRFTDPSGAPAAFACVTP